MDIENYKFYINNLNTFTYEELIDKLPVILKEKLINNKSFNDIIEIMPTTYNLFKDEINSSLEYIYDMFVIDDELNVLLSNECFDFSINNYDYDNNYYRYKIKNFSIFDKNFNELINEHINNLNKLKNLFNKLTVINFENIKTSNVYSIVMEKFIKLKSNITLFMSEYNIFKCSYNMFIKYILDMFKQYNEISTDLKKEIDDYNIMLFNETSIENIKRKSVSIFMSFIKLIFDKNNFNILKRMCKIIQLINKLNYNNDVINKLYETVINDIYEFVIYIDQKDYILANIKLENNELLTSTDMLHDGVYYINEQKYNIKKPNNVIVNIEKQENIENFNYKLTFLDLDNIYIIDKVESNTESNTEINAESNANVENQNILPDITTLTSPSYIIALINLIFSKASFNDKKYICKNIFTYILNDNNIDKEVFSYIEKDITSIPTFIMSYNLLIPKLIKLLNITEDKTIINDINKLIIDVDNFLS